MSNFPYRKIANLLISAEQGNNKQKGDALEEVAKISFCKVNGVRHIKTNVVNSAGSMEVDVVLFNAKPNDGFSFLSNILIFECKNWIAPVGSAELRVFRDKLRDLKVDTGILFAANGITGNADDKTAARDIIQRAKTNDGIQILVFTREEIEGFRSAKDIIDLTADKFGNWVLEIIDL